ncbi:MAG: hypothetical protein WA865_05950 [Spirulinaceae cyanobacterium]
MEKANLFKAQLKGCNLFWSKDVALKHAYLDNYTIHPDGYRLIDN